MSGMKNQVNRVVSLNRLPVRQLRLLKQIGRLADEQGMSVYLVGGVVRDLLLKRENWDLDLTIEGDGIAFARLVADRYKAGLAVFDRFATARLVFPDGLKVDIATTRRESYAQPADLPTVQPASIEEDLSRRDFTINAIAVQLNSQQFGRVLDPNGGWRDLQAHDGWCRRSPSRCRCDGRRAARAIRNRPHPCGSARTRAAPGTTRRSRQTGRHPSTRCRLPSTPYAARRSRR